MTTVDTRRRHRPGGDATVELGATRSSPSTAHGSVAFARTEEALRLLGQAIFDDISLVVSGLVTNASGTGAPRSRAATTAVR